MFSDWNRIPFFAPDFERLRPLFYLAALALVGLPLLAWSFQGSYATSTGQFSFCLFRDLFALPCPGCGMTRGMSLLLLGEWSLALRAHPLVPVGFAGWIFVAAAGVIRPFARLLLRFVPERLVLAGLLLMLAAGLVRLGLVVAAPEQAHLYVYDFSRDQGPLDVLRKGGALHGLLPFSP